MPIRRSPNGVSHTRPQLGRDRPEWVVAINRNRWSQSIGISGRNQPVRAPWAELIPSLPRLFMLLRPPARPTLAAGFVWPCLPNTTRLGSLPDGSET